MDYCETLGCGTLRSVVDTGNWSGISVASCTRSQNQGIPGAMTMMNQLHCLMFLDHLVKESCERVR